MRVDERAKRERTRGRKEEEVEEEVETTTTASFFCTRKEDEPNLLVFKSDKELSF